MAWEVGLVAELHGVVEHRLMVLLGGELVEGAQLHALEGVGVLHLLVRVHHALHVKRVAWERTRHDA